MGAEAAPGQGHPCGTVVRWSRWSPSPPGSLLMDVTGQDTAQPGAGSVTALERPQHRPQLRSCCHFSEGRRWGGPEAAAVSKHIPALPFPLLPLLPPFRFTLPLPPLPFLSFSVPFFPLPLLLSSPFPFPVPLLFSPSLPHPFLFPSFPFPFLFAFPILPLHFSLSPLSTFPFPILPFPFLFPSFPFLLHPSPSPSPPIHFHTPLTHSKLPKPLPGPFGMLHPQLWPLPLPLPCLQHRPRAGLDGQERVGSALLPAAQDGIRHNQGYWDHIRVGDLLMAMSGVMLRAPR